MKMPPDPKPHRKLPRNPFARALWRLKNKIIPDMRDAIRERLTEIETRKIER